MIFSIKFKLKIMKINCQNYTCNHDDSMTKISIIGAGGLSGKEFIRLSLHHPEIEIVHITSDSTKGKKLGEVFPDLPLINNNLVFTGHDSAIPADSLVVLAVPNDVSMKMAPDLLKKGHKVVDFSGSFRLHDREIFKKYYGLEQTSPETLDKAVFGIPEIFREKIKNASFISNPGCYPTSVIFPLHSLSRHDLAIDSVAISSASGVSGAGGRTEDPGFGFASVSENFRAYKILKHQHEPEIMEYGFPKNKKPELVFTPHLLPVYRGILSTVTVFFNNTPDEKSINEIFEKMSSEPFVRIYKTPEEIVLKNIVMTNFLDVSFRLRGRTLVIVSAIDNLIKGAAGQAMQNINLMSGIDETMGLVG